MIDKITRRSGGRFGHILPLLEALQDATYKNHVYVMSRPDGAVKIGRSQDPKDRKNTLTGRLGYKVTLHHSQDFGLKAAQAERILHRLFDSYRLDGEWFDITVISAINAVDLAVTDIGYDAPQIERSYLNEVTIAKIREIGTAHGLGVLTGVEQRVLRLASRKSGIRWALHSEVANRLLSWGLLSKSWINGHHYAVITATGRLRMFETHLPVDMAARPEVRSITRSLTRSI